MSTTKNLSTIRVINRTDKIVLFECPIDQLERAFQYAVEMEDMGIEVDIIKPSIVENFGTELGVDREFIGQLQSEMEKEILEHVAENSCCYSSKKSTEL